MIEVDVDVVDVDVDGNQGPPGPRNSPMGKKWASGCLYRDWLSSRILILFSTLAGLADTSARHRPRDVNCACGFRNQIKSLLV